jgi:excisionase family DNA binding protein
VTHALNPSAPPESVARTTPTLALNQDEAAAALGVSVDFFAEWIRHELRVVRRGRRRLYAVAELERWLAENGSRPLEGHE